MKVDPNSFNPQYILLGHDLFYATLMRQQMPLVWHNYYHAYKEFREQMIKKLRGSIVKHAV